MGLLGLIGTRGGISWSPTALDAYLIKKSVRFEDGDSANLSRIPSSSGNRQKWTLSFWFKHVSEAATHYFSTYGSTTDDGSYFRVWRGSNGVMNVSFNSYYAFISNEQFRDPSAWYHCVIAMDTTQSTAADRCKMWMNGVQISSNNAVATQNANYGWNHNHQSMIGNLTTQAGAASSGGDSYMAEVYNIDGQALTPSDFGKFDLTTGVWYPKEYIGTYTLDSHNDGTTWSSLLTSNGTLQNAGQAFDGIVTNRAQTQNFGSNKTITFAPSSAINFSSKLEVYCEQGSAIPTATWNGNVVNPGSGAWVTVYSGSGALSTAYPLVIDTESAGQYATLNGVRVDGEILIDSLNGSGVNSFYLNFDGDGKNYTSEISGSEQTPATYPKEKMFDGNPATAYLVGDSSTATWTPVGGLTFDSTLKLRAYHTTTNTSNSDVTFNWSGGSYTLVIDDVNAVKYYDVSSNVTSPVTSVTWTTDAASAGPYIYGVEVDGKVLVDHTGIESDSGGSNNHWTANNLSTLQGNGNWISQVTGTSYSSSNGIPQMFDNNATSECLLASGTSGNWTIPGGLAFTTFAILAYDGDGGTMTFNWSGGSYDYNLTYPAPASPVDISANLTSPLTSVTWDTPNTDGPYIKEVVVDGVRLVDNSYTDNDSLTDTPTNYGIDTGLGGEVIGNYCTWNPLDNGNLSTPGIVTLAQGNLKVTGSTTDSVYQSIWGTFGMTGGKYYWEIKKVSGTAAYTLLGIDSGSMVSSEINNSPTAYTVKETTGWKYNNSTSAAYDAAATWANGDTISMAFDADTGTLWYAKNGTWMNSATRSEIEAGTTTNAAWTGLSGIFRPVIGFYYANEVHEANFGQSPFAYAAPSGYKCLCTQNLPDPTIVDPSKYFAVHTFESTNSESSVISGLNFSPDMVWGKSRDQTYAHQVVDIVRGGEKVLRPHVTTAESDYSSNPSVSSWNSDGITGSTNFNINYLTGNRSVAWLWDAGTANTSASAGDLNGTAYNQDQTWTTGWSQSTAGTYLSGSGITGMTPDLMFNGDLASVGCIPAGQNGSYAFGSSVTFTPNGSTGIPCSTLVIKAVKGGSTTVLEINGVDCSSQVDTNWVEHTITMPAGETHLKTFKITADSGSDYIQVGYIIVNGARIIDSDVTGLTNIPTIASTYRANPTAGFSAITYTGAGSNATIAHGLAEAPAFIVSKSRTNASGPWYVYHQSLGYTQYLKLDDASVAATYAVWPEAPTSSVFTGGSDSVMAASDYLAYAWSEVPGYSKFGTWTGNGAQKFIYTGFKPAMVFLKQTNGGNDWYIFDDKRASYLVPSNNAAEPGTDFSDHELLSNGFSFNTNNAAVNGSSDTYVFCAWAKSPFKYTRASVGPS